MGVLEWLGIGKDVKDAADGVLGGVTKIIDSAKGQVPADKLVEMEAVRNKLITDVETLKQSSENAFQQFMLQYEGSASQVPKWILTLRSVIRPVTTIIFVLQLSIAATYDFILLALGKITSEGMILSHLPGGYWVIQGIIIGFWFGGKAGERIAEAFRK